jgi:3'-phosphoadenosine 5'-phosphosulfate sulfotransferase (PAPS reductase)/FAD synthetase
MTSTKEKLKPFLIDGPTVIKLSGGRTSGEMLDLTLKANDGLPKDAVVAFNNTGREDEKSLKFVHDIGRHWGVPIVMLEYRPGGGFEVVTFETASRNGEPFDAIIKDRMTEGTPALPNRVARYCSSELKTRTTIKYLQQVLGWDEWDVFMGIRADEPKRVSTFRKNPHPEIVAETVRIPLADIGVHAREVGARWAARPFDLELPNNNGKTMHGNCDLCFLKPAAQVQSLIEEKPERAVWWIQKEAEAEKLTQGSGCRFRDDRPSYARMAEFARDQLKMFDLDEPSLDCTCPDGG